MIVTDTAADPGLSPSPSLGLSRRPALTCPHQPPCPGASAQNREAAHVRAAHPEQGWSLLCNGVIVFEDTGELLPDGRAIAPHRPADSPTRQPTDADRIGSD